MIKTFGCKFYRTTMLNKYNVPVNTKIFPGYILKSIIFVWLPLECWNTASHPTPICMTLYTRIVAHIVLTDAATFYVFQQVFSPIHPLICQQINSGCRHSSVHEWNNSENVQYIFARIRCA